ncbi:hypothetical protein J2739_003981 [Variovorax soli]|uniref:Uncharacterized protein n=1 Tax=Variovorax soli TaxID=376815 RepID=A0ABU1NIA5_9BURK|nr:hypothetical protein [Variovorax soli]
MGRNPLLREQMEQHLPAVRMLEAARASDGELALAHTPQWIAAISDGSVDAQAMREIGFPWSEAMVERSRRSVGALSPRPAWSRYSRWPAATGSDIAETVRVQLATFPVAFDDWGRWQNAPARGRR